MKKIKCMYLYLLIVLLMSSCGKKDEKQHIDSVNNDINIGTENDATKESETARKIIGYTEQMDEKTGRKYIEGVLDYVDNNSDGIGSQYSILVECGENEKICFVFNTKDIEVEIENGRDIHEDFLGGKIRVEYEGEIILDSLSQLYEHETYTVVNPVKMIYLAD